MDRPVVRESRVELLRRMASIERNLEGPEDPAVQVLLTEYSRLLRKLYVVTPLMNREEVDTYRRKVAWYVENGGVYG